MCEAGSGRGLAVYDEAMGDVVGVGMFGSKLRGLHKYIHTYLGIFISSGLQFPDDAIRCELSGSASV